MITCAMCDSETREDAATCHECDSASCEGSGCGIWCADCSEWTCSDCVGEYNEDGDAICDCCAVE